MDERSSRRLTGSTLRRMRAEADRDVEVIHDTPRQERFPRARHGTARRSRHDVEWADVEPALARPGRPWDRPLPRPMAGARRRTHGRRIRAKKADGQRRSNRRFR